VRGERGKEAREVRDLAAGSSLVGCRELEPGQVGGMPANGKMLGGRKWSPGVWWWP
jgi:hypothetical protein